MSKGSMEPARITSGELKETRTIAGKLTIPPTRTMAPMYADLPDKPQINSVELKGNKSFEDLGDRPLSNAEIKELFDSVFNR